MKEQSTGTGAESRPTWESLEALARQGVQRLLQQLLEEEVEQVVGRRRYERRDGVDAAPGYRNGLGKRESRLLPLFKPLARATRRAHARREPRFEPRTPLVSTYGRTYGSTYAVAYLPLHTPGSL